MNCKNKNNSDSCKLDVGRGCHFCNCGEEPEAVAIEGCSKLQTTNWLKEMPDMLENDIVEVRFKNTRRSYFKNVNNLPLVAGDIIAVEASPGHDIGVVSLTGDMVIRQMHRVGFTPLNGEFKKVYRKAKPYDIEKWQEAIAMEHETMIRSRQIAAEMKLNMKIGDVEYQGDKIKAIFYYIADERVDFRELIKVFAEQFHIRIEMKQIGARQEAGRIGGIGSCGRELCCASWVSNFVSVTTNAARTQEISLNPQKLAGQCGKLKCCMVYELDSYIDARRDFPRVNQPLQALDGEYYLIKSDILAKTMSFNTSPNSMDGLITLTIKRVNEILEINRKGKKVDKIEDMNINNQVAEEPHFIDSVGEDSITRFDNSSKRRNNNRNNRNRKGGERANRPNDSVQNKDVSSDEESAQPKRERPERRKDNNNQERPRNNNNRNRNNNRDNSKRESDPKESTAPKENSAPKREFTPKNGEGNGSERESTPRNRNNRNRNNRRPNPNRENKGGEQSQNRDAQAPQKKGDDNQ